LPFGQFFAAVADDDHREKSSSRFAPMLFSVGLFAAAIILQNAVLIEIRFVIKTGSVDLAVCH
jgi:hypothetical protein